MVAPVVQQAQQTFVDANGQQVVMMPINMGQQYVPENIPAMLSTGSVRGRGQGPIGCFDRGSTKHSDIFFDQI